MPSSRDTTTGAQVLFWVVVVAVLGWVGLKILWGFISGVLLLIGICTVAYFLLFGGRRNGQRVSKD